jgi:hypothetical protein
MRPCWYPVNPSARARLALQRRRVAADGGALVRDMLGGEGFALWDRFLERPEGL